MNLGRRDFRWSTPQNVKVHRWKTGRRGSGFKTQNHEKVPSIQRGEITKMMVFRETNGKHGASEPLGWRPQTPKTTHNCPKRGSVTYSCWSVSDVKGHHNSKNTTQMEWPIIFHEQGLFRRIWQSRSNLPTKVSPKGPLIFRNWLFLAFFRNGRWKVKKGPYQPRKKRTRLPKSKKC